MTAVLYAIPASPPCATVEKALQLKAVSYRRAELIPVLHRIPQRLRFGVGSVPAVRFADGTGVSGSRSILRALEERVPAPALLPDDADARTVVERAEEWGDQVLQSIARRLVWASLRRHPRAVTSYGEGADLPVPAVVARLSAPLLAWMAQKAHGAADPEVRADLINLPKHLARVDGWLADGTLGGASPNAADLQIAASLRLLLTLEDLRPLLEGHPAAALARQLFPAYPGSVPAGVLPAKWIAAAGATSAPRPAPSEAV